MSPPSTSFWQRFSDWLVLPTGYTDLMRRLLGLAGIFLGLQAFLVFRGTVDQYAVSSWRLGNYLIDLPLPSLPLVAGLWLVNTLCSLALVLNVRRRIVPALMLLNIAYFSCIELTTSAMHWTVLYVCYLTALLFDSPGQSPTRRMFQVSTALCYFFSAFQKFLTTEFVHGETFYAYFRQPDAFRPFCLQIMQHLPSEAYSWLAWATIITETFLCFGLFFKATRKYALFFGIALHAIITISMHFKISLFALMVSGGYLSFFDRKGAPSEGTTVEPKSVFVAGHRVQLAAVSALMLLWFLVPARLYFNNRPMTELTTQDRRPWTFEMFSVLNQTKEVKISYVDSAGVEHPVAPRGRMLLSSGDNDVYALSRFVRRHYPQVEKVNIDLLIGVNHNWCLTKSLRQENGQEVIRTRRIAAADADHLAAHGAPGI